MALSNADVAHGFWNRRPEDDFPPDAVESVDEYEGGPRLNVACTQTELSSHHQRKLVKTWCDALPGFSNLRFLWFSSRMNQDLFDAACSVPRLEGLSVKWGAVKDLSPLVRRPGLRYLHIGSAPGITSIECLAEMRSLEVLELDNLHRIPDISVIGRLAGLEGLALTGGDKGWKIASLAPVARLSGLRYFGMQLLRPADRSLRPLHRLTKLRRLFLDWTWDAEEVLDLQVRNPELRIS